MVFNLFKKKEECKTYEGRVITDEEMSEMINPKSKSVFNDDVNEVNSMLVELKELIKNGRE